jgi:hypothetical protein
MGRPSLFGFFLQGPSLLVAYIFYYDESVLFHLSVARQRN